MKKSLLTKKVFILLTALFTLWQTGTGQALLVENFDYPSGALLSTNGWTAHSGGGTNSIDVIIPGLAFSGYPNSNIGGAAQLDNTGEDVNKTYTAQTSGSIYSAFLIKVNTPADGYFLHLGGNPIGTTFRAKMFTIGTTSPFNFGISVGSNTVTPISSGSYTSGTTYLCVLKYEIVSGTNNDIVSLFIISGEIPTTEPTTPTVGPLTDAAQTDINPGSIALRQFVSTQNIIIDGIRIATSWADAISDLYPPVPAFNPANSASDVAINVIPTITFDEPVLRTDGSEMTDGDLAALVTFKKTDASGDNVPFTAAIDASKKIITITPASDLANEQLYYIAVGPVEDASGNESTGSSATFTTISAATPSVTLTYPVGGEVMHAGQAATITWTSANITNVLIEVFAPDNDVTRTFDWIPFVPTTPAAAGMAEIIVPADAAYGTIYKIRISDLDNPEVISTGGDFTIISVATSLTDMRDRCIPNDIVRLNCETVVTFLRPANRNQKYIQDLNSGLLIDDAAAILTTPIVIGDKISGLEGKLGLYGGVLQIVPTIPTVSVVSSGNSVTIPSMSIPEYVANYAMYESMLVKITNVNFTEADGIATFASGTTYDIHEGSNSLAFRTFYAGDGNIVGTIIPEGVHNVTAIAGSFNTTPQVSSRTTSDFEFLTGINNPSETQIEMYPVPVSSELRVRNLMHVRSIEVLDITGKVLINTNVTRNEEIGIPVYQLNKGMYFIRFNTDKGAIVKRLIK